MAGLCLSHFRHVFPIRNKDNPSHLLAARAITCSIVITLSRSPYADVSDKQQCLYRLAPWLAHGLSIRWEMYLASIEPDGIDGIARSSIYLRTREP
jgi:hypothetical protein